MYIYDFYGINFNNEKLMIKSLSDFFGIKLESHESSFWGNYFLAKFIDRGEVKLIKNFHEEDNEWHYPDYKEFAWILQVSEANNMNYIFNNLLSYYSEEVDFLYRTEVEPLKSFKKYSFENDNFVMISKKDFISK